ncbi:MAG: polysaccharide deacetylase family protein [Proteobacteria bacterium]|nr:polysaccharide deacetylase family protein [Pseudomonadota bacterium]
MTPGGEPRRFSPSPALRASAGLHLAAAGAALAVPGAWPWALGAVAANHAALTAAGLWPRSAVLGPTLTRLPEAEAPGAVALTFDDGPDPEVTPRVLDLLDAAGARASFFCIGSRVAAHPGLAREIVRRGHRVENHTQDHPHAFAAYGPAALRRQVADAQAALADAAGEAPRWFRAPAGLRSPLLEPVLARAGLHLAAWSRRGFDTVDGSPVRVAGRLTRGLRGGDVLLLHDGNSAQTAKGEPVVLAALPLVLASLSRAGLRGVALPG